MQRSARELWFALAAIVLITLIYFYVIWILGRVPEAAGLFGHGIGILGFLLMIMTESLYSLRKRTRAARWGKMASWLQFHIFTGLVGPYLVLLHSSFRFNGLAGVVMLLTVVIVVSGFIGRYIYTAVPRTADGSEIERDQLECEVAEVEAEVRRWLVEQPEASQTWARRLSGTTRTQRSEAALVLGRAWFEMILWVQLWVEKRRMPKEIRAQLDQLNRLVSRQRQLKRQISSLAFARRLLGVWHSVHIPIGMALFTAAFIHAGAAVYFASLLR